MAHSSDELQQQFSWLQRKQQTQQRCDLWRSLFVSSLAGSILTLAMSSYWQIKSSSQIKIEGDRDLAVSTIENRLQISYPQSIVTVSTGQINRQLQSLPALESVRVTKSLFPPGVNIYLQERIPVAMVVSSTQVGFLDRQGVWLDPSFYEEPENLLPSNPLKVVNFIPQYSILWSEIFGLMATYQTLDIREVHWDEGGNLWLITSNFKVFLGSDNSLLPRQFAALASFPDSNTEQNLHNVTQIDLSNPDVPFLTVNGQK
jgi:cell division protein FtsQ